MDLDDVRSVLESSGVDIWTLIDTAVTVAALDYGIELKDRRDGIIGKLYAVVAPMCQNCIIAPPPENGRKVLDDEKVGEIESSPEHVAKRDSPYTPVSVGGGDSDDGGEERNRSVNDEKSTILAIREQIDDPDQTEDLLVDLLQTLADMDITFRGLQDTDIGRHVNQLRKHPSADVRGLVKFLVRKWKDLVDEWVSSNTARDVEHQSSPLIADEDSPQQYASRNHQNGHQQAPDFGYSPNPHNGNSSVDRTSYEPESKLKTAPARREPAFRPKPNQGGSLSAPTQNKQKEVEIDPDRFASARKRLQANYQEAKNAKRQRTIQVMDIHEIPKPKNGFIARNKVQLQDYGKTLMGYHLCKIGRSWEAALSIQIQE